MSAAGDGLWTNWSGSVSSRPDSVARPTSEDEIATLVVEAKERDREVRVVGSGHSFVPLCDTSGLLLSLDGMRGVRSIDPDRCEARIFAGTKIFEIGPALRTAGLAMETLGDIDRQAIAGAIATGTHGTGGTIGNLSSQIVAMRLIRADGEILELSSEVEPAMFRSARVALGTLGIITELTVRLVPTFRLHETIYRVPFDECMANLDELVAGNRHFEFFYYAHKDECEIKTLNPTDRPVDDLTELEGERIGHSDLIFPSERNLRFNEIEFAVSAPSGPRVVTEVRALLRGKHRGVRWPLEYRTVAADDAHLSPAFGRATVTVSAHQGAELAYREFFDDVESVFRDHGGRPHWGKLHSHTAAELAQLYPQWDEFREIRRRVDPENRFLNDYLRDLFGETAPRSIASTW